MGCIPKPVATIPILWVDRIDWLSLLMGSECYLLIYLILGFWGFEVGCQKGGKRVMSDKNLLLVYFWLVHCVCGNFIHRKKYCCQFLSLRFVQESASQNGWITREFLFDYKDAEDGYPELDLHQMCDRDFCPWSCFNTIYAWSLNHKGLMCCPCGKDVFIDGVIGSHLWMRWSLMKFIKWLP